MFSEVNGNTAYLQSHLTATHAFSGGGGVSVAYRTYKNDAG
jgi:hypothetical protein